MSTMAAPEELAAVGLKHMQGAYAAEAQTKRASAAELRARKEKNEASCKVTIAIGTADAVRQLLFKQAKLRKQNGESVDGDDIILRNYKSMAAYNSYANEQLRPDEDEQISISAFKHHVGRFWLFAHKWALLEFGGATIERDAFDRDQWTDKGPSSTVYAELGTLEYVLAEGFAESLRVRIPAGSLGELVAEASGKPARVYRKAKAPAKQPRRRSKKAAPAPAETTEAAETTPPKAKAPARRPRRRGRRREDDDDDDDFAPPPKAKAQDDDEIETAAGEALAPAGTKTAELVDLMADNKMLQRDLATRDKEIADLKAAKQSEIAARDEELAAARAEVAAYKEEIKEKEADSEDLVKHSQDTIGALKFELAEVKNELARVKDEIAREKDKNKAGRRQTAVSPLCDATNV